MNKTEENKEKEPKVGAYEVNFSRIGFIFIIFTVLSSGYINEILSCQMRYVFETNAYFRHFVGILMFFIFIMLEGGWSFNAEEDDKFPNNWASGNVIHTAIMAFALYVVFLISSKSSFYYNIVFLGLILLIYLINTQRTYNYIRKQLSEDMNTLLLRIEYVSSFAAVVGLVGGFVEYFVYQKALHKKDFSFTKFILGAHRCSSVNSLNR